MLVRSVRLLRRAGKLSPFVSVYLNKRQRCVYLASDAGRVCRYVSASAAADPELRP